MEDSLYARRLKMLKKQYYEVRDNIEMSSKQKELEYIRIGNEIRELKKSVKKTKEPKLKPHNRAKDKQDLQQSIDRYERGLDD